MSAVYVLVLSDIILIYLVQKSLDVSVQAAQFSLTCNRISTATAWDLNGILISQRSLFINHNIHFIKLLYIEQFQWHFQYNK